MNPFNPSDLKLHQGPGSFTGPAPFGGFSRADGSAAHTLPKFRIDVAGALNRYKEQNLYERGYIVGPVYPIDAFSDHGQDLPRSAVAESMLRVRRIGDRLYTTGRDLDAFVAWTGERVVLPQRWQGNLEQVTASLDGIDGLRHPDRAAWNAVPFTSLDSGGRADVKPCTVQDVMSGPITPIDHFDNAQQQVLGWCIRNGLVPHLVLEGVAYVSYSDVYGGLLSDHFESELDDPAAWDGTYAPAWSPWRRVEARWVKPRGFKDAVRSDMFPRISVHRETRHVDEGAESHFMKAAYPKHVADRAAEMFLALYREEGFAERFRKGQRFDEDKDLAEPLSIFCPYETEWIKKFAAEGCIRLCTFSDGQYVVRSELLYYDMFTAKITEDELDLDTIPEANSNVEVRLDGTFCHGGPFGQRGPLRRKRDLGTDR